MREDSGSVVLIIDDDPTVRDLMRRTLEKEGFTLRYASGSEQGLRMARQLRPAVITLDVMMPGMDGWAVLSALKNDPEVAEIPVVMVTIVDDKNLGYALGASDYLTKPIDRKRLASVLRKFRQHGPGRQALIVDDDQPRAGWFAIYWKKKAGWSPRRKTGWSAWNESRTPVPT